MYVGRKHTATITTRSILPFRCIFCKKESLAVVIGVGQGQGNSPYFLDESGAKDRAKSSAERAAEENARLTLSMAACPKCGRRDESVARGLKTKAVLGVVGAMIVLPLMGIALDALQSRSFGLYIFMPCALLAAWMIWTQQKWKWQTVAGRVAFVEEDAPEHAVSGGETKTG
jgi:hypothetical protein